jgi:hypothetical protein
MYGYHIAFNITKQEMEIEKIFKALYLIKKLKDNH